jgi:hypothetical protein
VTGGDDASRVSGMTEDGPAGRLGEAQVPLQRVGLHHNI